MQHLSSIEAANEKVLEDMQVFFSAVSEHIPANLSSTEVGLRSLRNLRSELYENLNQIQHELLIVNAMQWLQQNGYADSVVNWYWNPRQTGDANEPDIRGVSDNGKILISGEATTSEKPQGVIDTRMRNTLRKLNTFEGEKFYFVRTQAMKARASTKCRKAGFSILVEAIESET